MSIIGIDLGTTNSLAAELDAAGRLQIVHNSEGSNLTPSVVWFESPERRAIVGAEAKKMVGTSQYIFQEFKRKIGTDKTYPLFGGLISPTDLSALVLKKIREDVESSIGTPEAVVVTVPASFGNEQREATIAAAKAAGLDVQHIINEPTAAALYYEHESTRALDGIYVVYDLGGGTFDVSIIRARHSEVEVLASSGVSELGGKDFDDKVKGILAKKFEQKTGLRYEESRISFAATPEDVKKSLSVREHTTVRLVSKEAGPVSLEISRAEFESEISSLVAQAEMLCEGAIDQAGIAMGDIAEVFLAGGSSRVPVIQRSVRQLFGKESTIRKNPDEVVALGAALYAAHKAGRARLNPL